MAAVSVRTSKFRESMKTVATVIFAAIEQQVCKVWLRVLCLRALTNIEKV